MFRYKIRATPGKLTLEQQQKAGEEQSTATDEKFLERVKACSLSLLLYDTDDFLLRTEDITLQRSVNDQDQVVQLDANSSAQMDLDEYKKLLGNDEAAGRYNISWKCD